MPPQPAARITSRQNPLVTRFRDAAQHTGGTDASVLVEGARLVDEARRAGWAIEAAAFTDTALERDAAAQLFDALAPPITRVLVSERVMAAMSPAHTPSGVVAIARQHPWALDRILTRNGGLVVVAMDVQDPGNVGAVVRAAEAAGAMGVIASGASADPFGWKALRGAMGSTFRLPVLRVPGVEEVLRACRGHGLRIIATALHGTPVTEVALDGACAVLLGAEGTGLPQALVDAADARLTIPMRAPVESLNVAVAAGIILYEARRQRGRR